ncbi:P-loop ATPase, Sll1717 family [Aquabacterium sp. OR-4]|uniref:P-loop ATPase, Sll1717 family n=1 Tax=Aquabacterium sp. OR-4 TaxID=2978127 RepID=UPI0021B48D8F|nr:hypothetical protein [Aquabacterium sp. OR-4]MDT7838079.1 hypothetical protein [Aquabacterium sp. OR-4]
MSDALSITFGDRVAENESQDLSAYFIKTEHWEKVRSGKADIIFGAKGAGKSALYTLLFKESDLLRQEGTTLISAEKPVGQTVFSEIKNSPPTTEVEFVTLWKIYICQLIIQQLQETENCAGKAADVKNKLVEAGLIQEKNTLKRLVNSAMAFARRIINVESFEGGAAPDGSLVTGKITFRTPTAENHRLGYVSVDELLEILNEYLTDRGLRYWVLFDRLDVAFDQDAGLEKNALRALFKTYRDIEDLEAISLKIFLRDDIWKRITDEGFRESSHITRTTTIDWSPQSLLNLIILRAIKNPDITREYSVNPDVVERSHAEQRSLYYKIFPEQVDIGEKQSDTFDWILNRVRDGLANAAPREVIHFHNEIIVCEKELMSIGARKVESPNLFSRSSIKSATLEVSRVKAEQNLFAENPHLKPFIQGLDGNKAEQSLETLAGLWGKSLDETKRIAAELVVVGFFEQRAARDEGIFKIPFIYRPYLRVTQGKAFS